MCRGQAATARRAPSPTTIRTCLRPRAGLISQGWVTDLATDQPANPARTITYTLNVTNCLAAPALAWNPGEEAQIRFWAVDGFSSSSSDTDMWPYSHGGSHSPFLSCRSEARATTTGLRTRRIRHRFGDQKPAVLAWPTRPRDTCLTGQGKTERALCIHSPAVADGEAHGQRHPVEAVTAFALRGRSGSSTVRAFQASRYQAMEAMRRALDRTTPLGELARRSRPG